MHIYGAYTMQKNMLPLDAKKGRFLSHYTIQISEGKYEKIIVKKLSLIKKHTTKNYDLNFIVCVLLL